MTNRAIYGPSWIIGVVMLALVLFSGSALADDSDDLDGVTMRMVTDEDQLSGEVMREVDLNAPLQLGSPETEMEGFPGQEEELNQELMDGAGELEDELLGDEDTLTDELLDEGGDLIDELVDEDGDLIDGIVDEDGSLTDELLDEDGDLIDDVLDSGSEDEDSDDLLDIGL